MINEVDELITISIDKIQRNVAEKYNDILSDMYKSAKNGNWGIEIIKSDFTEEEYSNLITLMKYKGFRIIEREYSVVIHWYTFGEM